MTDVAPSARPTIEVVEGQDADNFDRLCEVIFPVMQPYVNSGVPEELVLDGRLLFELSENEASRVNLVVSFIGRLNSRIQIDYQPVEKQGYYSSGPRSYTFYSPDDRPSLYAASIEAVESRFRTMAIQKMFHESLHRAAMVRQLGSDSTRFTGLLLPPLERNQ